MDKAFNKIGDEYLTDYEIKKRILSYKNPEPDEKFPVQDGCCICLRTVNNWFHGQGVKCSPECDFIYKKTFGSGKNVFKTTDIEVRKWMKIRNELWEMRGWVRYTDSNNVREWLNNLPEDERNKLLKKIEYKDNDMTKLEFISYLICRMLNRWRYDNGFSEKFNNALDFLKSEKGKELKENILNSLIEEHIKYLENTRYQSDEDKNILKKLKERNK